MFFHNVKKSEMMLGPASFLAPSGTSTFPVAATRLQNLSLWKILCPDMSIVLIFLRDRSSLLLSKTFAAVDALL